MVSKITLESKTLFQRRPLTGNKLAQRRLRPAYINLYATCEQGHLEKQFSKHIVSHHTQPLHSQNLSVLMWMNCIRAALDVLPVPMGGFWRMTIPFHPKLTLKQLSFKPHSCFLLTISSHSYFLLVTGEQNTRLIWPVSCECPDSIATQGTRASHTHT